MISNRLENSTTDTILERLAEVVAWCGPRVDVNDPKGCLRTTGLRPRPLEDGRRAVVTSVAHARYLALSHRPKQRATGLSDGRLLIYQPDMNLADGLEEAETRGYVDVDNIPPWDTWVDYVHEARGNYLLSWVPGPFVTLVSAGIAMNPEMCIRWLDETDLELRRALRRRGLSGPA